jgi:hypothetical protein
VLKKEEATMINDDHLIDTNMDSIEPDVIFDRQHDEFDFEREETDIA